MGKEQFLHEMSKKCSELIKEKKLKSEDAKIYEQAWIDASSFILKKEILKTN